MKQSSKEGRRSKSHTSLRSILAQSDQTVILGHTQNRKPNVEIYRMTSFEISGVCILRYLLLCTCLLIRRFGGRAYD